MEKVRYGGVVFDLVPGGFDTLSAKEQVIVKHQMGGKTLAEIKAIAKVATGSLDLLDEDGGLIRSLDGYVYGGDIREVENYLVEEKRVPIAGSASAETGDGETDQGPDQPYEIQEVRADIAVVVFKLPDVRTELAEVKAVQDEILVSMLGGGI